MGKLLFWIIVVLLVLLVARLLARQAARAKSPTPQAAPRARGKTASLPMMTRCAHCGIHLPRAEALLIGGQTWCCEDHARAGARPLE